MQVAFTFGDKSTGLSPASAARILADVNYLHLAALGVAAGRISDFAVAEIGLGRDRYGLAAMIESPSIIGDIRLLSVEYGSPFKVLTAVFQIPKITQRLCQTWSIIEEIIMFRERRERYEAETGLIRQQALAAQIANYNQIRELLAGVPDPTERARLEKALTSGIIAMIDNRNPEITEMKLLGPPQL